MRTKITIVLFFYMAVSVLAQAGIPATPAEAVELIKKNINRQWNDETVDTFKAGNPDAALKGIAVCMFADMTTLRQAVKEGCNLIITHEPVFYNHADDTMAYHADPVFIEKMKFIQDNQLIIFRFHDHIHMMRPDGISLGMISSLGLEDYAVDNGQTHFEIPETTVRKFAGELKERLEMESIRIIGNPEMQFTKVTFTAGAPGGSLHIRMLSDDDTEVLIAGEASEWETYLYANDAVEQGRHKAVIFLGHIKSEEAGMEYCSRWLKGFIENTPVHFIENKPNYLTW